MTSNNIRANVMSRVRTVHRVRPFLRGGVFSFALLTFSLMTLGREVFVAQVFRNMPSPSHVLAVIQFILSAFQNTRFIVQVLSVLSFMAFAWLARETIVLLTPHQALRQNTFA